MKFHTLELKGDQNAEKKKEHLPAYTKQEYLRRKRREDRPPLHNRRWDTARRSQCPEDTVEKIRRAFEGIISSHLVREERIDKLTKRSQSTGLTAHVYRLLSAEAGEGWYLKITDRKGNIFSQETIGGDIRYVDRLNSRLYAKSEWRGNTFVLLERFGREIFSISVPC